MRLAVAVALVALWFADARADHAINTLIGDASWAGHAGGDEVARVRAHLAFAHALLAERDVSQLTLAQRTARAASLADLARYIERGVFPRRTSDGYEGRRPRFIDDRGVHCAVGQLIADSGDEELAQAINARFEYAHVREMTEPALAAWATERGFTVDELALIQPGYSQLPTPESVEKGILLIKDSVALECARRFTPMKSLLIIVINDKHGATYVRTKSTDPFARCVVGRMGNSGGGAYMGSPREFSIGIDLSFRSPQKELEKRVKEWYPRCMPRPGAIPREAALEASTSKAGFVMHATTSPSNPLVDSCIVQEAREAFRDFGAGAWSLRTSQRIALRPYVEIDRDALSSYGTMAATDCAPTPAPNATSTITVTAQPEDKELTITATGSPEFSACMSDALNKQFASMFRVSYTVDKKQVDFFRIDAHIKTSVTIKLESAAARKARSDQQQRELEQQRNRY